MKSDYIPEDTLDNVLSLLMPDNRLVMRVALHTGLRIGDVVALRSDQLKSRFTVVEQKTGKRRRVTLPAALLDDLRQCCSGSPWVFPSPRDPEHHRTRQAVWKDVKRAASALRLKVVVSPHSARKVYAVRRYADSGDIDKVSRALNHSDPVVTMLYAMADQITDSRYKSRKLPGHKYKV